MKTWKQFVLFGLLAIIGLLFTACPPDDNGKTNPVLCTCPNGITHYEDETCCEGENCNCIIIPRPVLCTCNPKDHLGIDESCNCGGENCECTLQDYGELYQDSGINIYRVRALSAFTTGTTILATASQNVKDAYTGMTPIDKILFGGKQVNEVHIFPFNDPIYSVYDGIPIDQGGTIIYQGQSYCYIIKNGVYIFGFREANSVDTIRGRLEQIAIGDLIAIPAIK